MRFTVALVTYFASVALAAPEGLSTREQDPEAVIDPLEGKADLLAATNASAPDLVYAGVLGNGLLEGFVDPSVPVIDARDLEGSELDARQGCGANTVRCSESNRARTGICGRLLDILGGPAFVNQPLPAANFWCSSDVHVSTNNRCCISWNRRVGGSKTQHLFNAAVKTMNICKTNALVSGWSPDVKLGKTCVRQCLSNRPNGC
ncbi:hypothetical protein CKAH01_05688 [Colletotrichum kahawae]|uniref:WD-like domain-containing protein n=1 Tax=Colletotrichum kahawae TaxID=34407 RepID=A0AAD9YE68_COLKA|nr:hypothetical protein CKAH01_05688 [Colletotrichum kahawae]